MALVRIVRRTLKIDANLRMQHHELLELLCNQRPFSAERLARESEDSLVFVFRPLCASTRAKPSSVASNDARAHLAPMTEVLNRFGGFGGLFGTRVREADASLHRDFFVFKQQKRTTVGFGSTCFTPVPNNPLNLPNLFEPSVIDA
jgi:hypothetical protein